MHGNVVVKYLYSIYVYHVITDSSKYHIVQNFDRENIDDRQPAFAV